MKRRKKREEEQWKRRRRQRQKDGERNGRRREGRQEERKEHFVLNLKNYCETAAEGNSKKKKKNTVKEYTAIKIFQKQQMKSDFNLLVNKILQDFTATQQT